MIWSLNCLKIDDLSFEHEIHERPPSVNLNKWYDVFAEEGKSLALRSIVKGLKSGSRGGLIGKDSICFLGLLTLTLVSGNLSSSRCKYIYVPSELALQDIAVLA